MPPEDIRPAVLLTQPAAGAARTGVVVVRVWQEGEEREVRARVTACLDVADGREEVVLLPTVERIRAFVGDWLDRFAAGKGPSPKPEPGGRSRRRPGGLAAG